jgi:RNA-directed DNA polymerase
MFEAQLEENLDKLAKSLKEGSYRPAAIKRVWIPKPGGKDKRPLGIPTVRDRVVQAALRHVLEPIFEYEFREHSYGFRPGKGCKDALRRGSELLKQGDHFVVDADLKSYFDTIPHEPLLDLVKERISDNRVLSLVEQYLRQKVMATIQEWTPEQGTPQGAGLSPLPSNIYVHPLDLYMEARGYKMVRYADDFVILCRSAEEARQALWLVDYWTSPEGLSLHPDKTRIANVTLRGGFDFLGYHFERGYCWPCKKSLQKLKDAIRVETGRSNGMSLEMIIFHVNRILVGRHESFKECARTTFGPIDGWIRMRLRSILRKRRGGRGRGRGFDHQRWPNKFFAVHGLFSLLAAYDMAGRFMFRLKRSI